MADELFSAPSDLTLASDNDLTELETRAVAEFERVNDPDGAVDPSTLQYAMQLADDLDRIRAELRVREVRAAEAAGLQQARVAEQLSQLQARVNGAPPPRLRPNRRRPPTTRPSPPPPRVASPRAWPR